MLRNRLLGPARSSRPLVLNEAAKSGSKTKAPGSAGGYLLDGAMRDQIGAERSGLGTPARFIWIFHQREELRLGDGVTVPTLAKDDDDAVWHPCRVGHEYRTHLAVDLVDDLVAALEPGHFRKTPCWTEDTPQAPPVAALAPCQRV